MSSLRIAFCLPELFLDATAGGQLTEAAGIQQEYIAAGLRGRGHTLTMVAPEGLSDIAYTRDSRNVTTARRSWSRAWWFRAASSGAWRLQRLARIPYLNVFSNYRLFDGYVRCLPGHDLVHERNALYRIGAAKACKTLGLPYVLFFDADEILEHDVMGAPLVGLLRWRARNCVRYNLRAADRVVCVSAAAKTRLVNTWRVEAQKIAVCPNAVDVHRFRPGLDSTNAVRRSLAADGPLIVFVGGFYEWHDIDTLLAAFAHLLAVFPNARLVLVGDGARRIAMASRAVELGIDAAVIFKGLVPHAEVPPLMSAADIAVAPYKDSGQQFWLSPLKLFEYMASGTAVVATGIGQITEVISHGRNGVLVPPGNVQALAEALRQLLDQPGLRSELARQAREDVVREHSWDVYAGRLEDVYRQAIRDRRARAGRARRRQQRKAEEAA